MSEADSLDGSVKGGGVLGCALCPRCRAKRFLCQKHVCLSIPYLLLTDILCMVLQPEEPPV